MSEKSFRFASRLADKGFDIMEHLIPIGVKLSIPPFLQRKASFVPENLLKLGG